MSTSQAVTLRDFTSRESLVVRFSATANINLEIGIVLHLDQHVVNGSTGEGMSFIIVIYHP